MLTTLSPRIAADLFEEEYVIANLETGLYYSLQGLATYLLRNLPADIRHVAEELARSFPDHAASVREIAKKLEEEQIVLTRPEAASPLGKTIMKPETALPSSFNKYADMQDLLLLDPIHEVDEDGWEVRKVH